MIIVGIVIATIVGTLGLLGLGIKLGQRMQPEEKPGKTLTWFNIPKETEPVET